MKPNLLVCFIFAAGVTCLLTSSAANAATWYVATYGSDENPGTHSEPFASVQYAINACGQSGDTIILADGVYNAADVAVYWWDGSHYVPKSVVMRSQSDVPENCVVDLALTQRREGILLVPHSGSSDCTFRGITFRNAPRICIAVNGNESRLTLTNCVFSGNALAVNEYAGTTTIDHCGFFNNNSENYTGGVSAVNAAAVISNCTFDGNISTNAPAAVYRARSIVNCTFTRNRATYMGSTICRVPTITNCTFLGNGNNTILCVDTTHTVATNCVFRDEGNHFLTGVGIPGGTIEVRYSNVRGGYTGEGNIDVTPAFVRLPGTLSAADPGNLRLLPQSAGINAGTATALEIAATDPDGLPRVLGGAPDMSAFESWDTTTGMWFVDAATGSDSFVGSPAQPFATVTRAITAASAGQRVLIGPGSYGADRPRITKSLRLAPWAGGPARIGQP